MPLTPAAALRGGRPAPGARALTAQESHTPAPTSPTHPEAAHSCGGLSRVVPRPTSTHGRIPLSLAKGTACTASSGATLHVVSLAFRTGTSGDGVNGQQQETQGPPAWHCCRTRRPVLPWPPPSLGAPVPSPEFRLGPSHSGVRRTPTRVSYWTRVPGGQLPALRFPRWHLPQRWTHRSQPAGTA